MAKQISSGTALHDYLDQPAADTFYFQCWGGEHIHIGIYESAEEPIRRASSRTVAHLANLIRLDSKQRILDLGTAYGGGARFLAEEYQCKVSCLHLSQTGLARNKQLLNAHSPEAPIHLVEGQFDTLPFSDSSFDVLWSTDAIHLLPHPPQIFQEATRVLRPGGTLVFTVPVATGNSTALNQLLEFLPIESLPRRSDYEKWAPAYGFREPKIQERPDQLLLHYDAIQQFIAEQRPILEQSCGTEFLANKEAEIQAWQQAATSESISWLISIWER